MNDNHWNRDYSETKPTWIEIAAGMALAIAVIAGIVGAIGGIWK